MLLAVEGGGFFSSSASGYSKGLTLLLLGQKKEEKPMRVTPWNQYQLVDQEMDPEQLQLGSGKNRLVRGCTSFVCFGRTAGLESSSPLKVGPTQNQEVLPEPPDVDKSKDCTVLGDNVVEDKSKEIISLKSCLKKSAKSAPVSGTGGDDDGNSSEREALCGKEKDVTCEKERRKVEWTDTIGGELFEIREFEMRGYMPSFTIKRQVQIVTACCAVHNFVRRFGAPDKYSDPPLAEEEDDLAFERLLSTDVDAETKSSQSMSTFRDKVAHAMWEDLHSSSG